MTGAALPRAPDDGAGTLLVWGAGGHGRVVAELARLAGFAVAGYADRNAEKVGSVIDSEGANVLTTEDRLPAWLGEAEARALALGVGDNRARLERSRRFDPAELPPLLHPAATMSPSATLEPGAVMFAGAVANSGSSIGWAAIVNTAAVIEHDVVLGAGVHVSPGAVIAGGAVVEEGTWVGANATVLPGVRIGAWSIVGAGAVVLRDVEPGATVVGNPARVIRGGRNG